LGRAFQALGLGGSPARLVFTHWRETTNLEAYKLCMQAKLILRLHRNRLGAQEALPLFQRAAAQDSGYFQPYLGFADADLVMFNETHDNSWLERARHDAIRAQTLSPNRPEARIQIAKIQIATGQYQEAIQLLHHALEGDPASDDAYRVLGRAHLLSGNSQQALAAYQKAVDLGPRSWRNYNSLGAACLRLGRTSDAERALRKAIELEPQIDDNYTDLGDAYLQSGEFREAIGLYEKALKLNPDASNYSNLGTAQFYLGQYQQSVAMFQKAIALDPKSEELMGNLADAYRWSRQPDKALAAYFHATILGDQALELNPKDAETRGRMAVYYAKMDDFETARASILAARSLNPQSASVQYFEAVVSTLGSNFDRANRELRTAIKSGYPLPMAANDPELRPLFSNRGF